MSAPEGFFYRVTFSPVVLIKLTTPIPLEHALSDWIEPLRRIVSLSTGRQEPVTYLAVGTTPSEDADRQPLQVYGSGIQQQPFASRANDIRVIHRSFQVSPNDMSLLDLLRAWQKLRDDHHPLLETYADMMHAPTQHPRSQLLLLLQALEGLHGHETQQGYATRSVRRTGNRGRGDLGRESGERQARGRAAPPGRDPRNRRARALLFLRPGELPQVTAES